MSGTRGGLRLHEVSSGAERRHSTEIGTRRPDPLNEIEAADGHQAVRNLIAALSVVEMPVVRGVQLPMALLSLVADLIGVGTGI